MNRKVRLISLALASLLLISCSLFLFSCTKNEPVEEPEVIEKIALIENGKTDYTLVVAEKGTADYVSWVFNIATTFRTAVKTKTGVNLMLGSSVLNRGEVEDPDAKEIVIGKTPRQDSITLAEQLTDKTYIIEVVNNRVFILASDGINLQRAVDDFLHDYVTEDGNLEVPKALSVKDTDERLYISIFGDSISTYNGYSGGTASGNYNKSLTYNSVYYFAQIEAKDTWWNKLITSLDGVLCVNNSYSGGRVSDDGTRKNYTYSNTSTRAANLHQDSGAKPDVICIYFGTNDFNGDVSLIEFENAYKQMLHVMTNKYPNAKIFCATIIPSKGSDEMVDSTHQKNTAQLEKLSYCNIIKSVASQYGATVVDLYTELGENYYVKNGVNYYYDGVLLKKGDGSYDTHPNEKGMQNICNCFEAVIKNWLENK